MFAPVILILLFLHFLLATLIIVGVILKKELIFNNFLPVPRLFTINLKRYIDILLLIS